VAAALTLVIVGGLALVNALTSPPPGPAPSSVGSPTGSADDGSQEPPEQSDLSAVPLQITVVGSPTNVFVRVVGDSGAVLQQGVLDRGETRMYDQVPLNVVVADSSSVRVRIYGELQRDSDGGRGEWTVPARSGR
jgi:hypothetical protein